MVLTFNEATSATSGETIKIQNNKTAKKKKKIAQEINNKLDHIFIEIVKN